MAYTAIANIAPQFENYPNYWIKAYVQGTTTPKVMATDKTGATTVSKFEINSDGFIVTAGAALVIPFIDGYYDLWLFPTAALADANTTGGAIQLADNINASLDVNIQTVTASDFGAIGSGDETTELAEFFAYCYDNNTQGILAPIDYTVSGVLLNKATSGSLHVKALGGQATITYSGSELSSLIKCDETQNVSVSNITIEAANLICTPLWISKATDISGFATLDGVQVLNAKQTALTTNPTGIVVSGQYKAVEVSNCIVDGVTYTDAARSGTGIALIQLGGTVSVRGCTIKNISTPFDSDADGLKVYGTAATVATTFMGVVADIYNNVFSNCEGRCIKLQISEAEVHGNQFKLSLTTSTITEWRGVDCQDNNGNIHDNAYLIGASVTLGNNSTLCTFTNDRNDGNRKTSRFCNNRASIGVTGLNYMVAMGSTYGDTSLRVENNEIIGEAIGRGVQYRAIAQVDSPFLSGAAGIDSVNIHYNNNTVQDYSSSDLYSMFDLEDFGDKMFLEIRNNTVLNPASSSRLTDSVGFGCNGNFSISNNRNTTDRIDWAFDMDDLRGENNFTTGSQTITNKGTGLTTFTKVSTSNVMQRHSSSNGAASVARVRNGATTWFNWVEQIGMLTATTTALVDITDGVNVNPIKQQFHQVGNSTTGRIVYAADNTDGGLWLFSDGTTAHTPV